MIRYVVAAVLAVALVAVSLPAISDAAGVRTASELDRFGTDLDRAAADLHTGSDPVDPGIEGAHRLVTVSLPRASLTTAKVRFVALCPSSHGRTTLRYAIGARPRVTDVLEAEIHLPEDGIRFAAPGEYVVELRYERRGGTATVVATAPEGSSTETGPGAACDSSTASARRTGRDAGANRPSELPGASRTPR